MGVVDTASGSDTRIWLTDPGHSLAALVVDMKDAAIEDLVHSQGFIQITVPVTSFLQDHSIAQLTPQLLEHLAEADSDTFASVGPTPAGDDVVSGEL